MTLPLVAIVGRANVGKSTLVNRIASTTKAIVDKESGVTRDRNYVITDWNGKHFGLIDTGGLELDRTTQMDREVVKQSLLAIDEADVIVFVVDSQSGVMPLDEEVAKVLRKSEKPKLLVANKCDNVDFELASHDFHKIGFGEPLPVSSLHGLGIGELLDKIAVELPVFEIGSRDFELSIAIVGRPNVGKSSLLNTLLGAERAIVTDKPGTTRDAVDTIFTYDDSNYRLIDTAGIKRKNRMAKNKRDSEAADYYGYVRTIRALSEADVALLVFDASEGATRQDVKIAGLCEDKGCATILVLNKWDIVKKNKATEDTLLDIEERMKFIAYAPLLTTSALTGQGVEKLLPEITRSSIEYKRRISTPRLNQMVKDLKASGHQHSVKGKKMTISYITQIRDKPPRFAIFINHPQIVNTAFRKYVENQLRERFGFEGCPIKLHFRKKRKD